MIVLAIVQISIAVVFIYSALIIFKPELINEAKTSILLFLGCRNLAVKAFCKVVQRKYPTLKLRAIRSADPYEDMRIIEYKPGAIEYDELPKMLDDFAVKYTTMTAKKDTFIMCSSYKEHTIDTYSLAFDKNLIVLPSIIYKSDNWDAVC